ncbi:MAG: RloB domain-containing protein [Melioribacter sp.]|nr:RloB domain-containing protein [Melioribacter sp.]
MEKAWQRKRPYSKRVSNDRHIRNRILILCEGGKTEPNYFRKFPVNIDLVEVNVDGAGANTISLVKDAIRIGQEAIERGHSYNQIWCVFDRDSFPAGNFNRAFNLAMRNRIRIAYSNQCFELWYFLHYHFSDAAIDRYSYTQ